MPDSDSDLMTLQEVAELAGVKPRAVTEWVTKRVLVPRGYRKRPGMRGGPVSVFGRDEVEELLRTRAAAKTQVFPNGSGPLAPAAKALVRTAPVAPLAIDRKRYLTIGEAVAYTGCGKGYIREQVEARKIGPHGSLVYRREELDKL